MRALDNTEVLTDSSIYRNHAEDILGYGDNAVIGSGRFLSGGVEKFLRVPSSFSLDDLQEKSFTFSTWVKIDEEPPTKAENAFYASGYIHTPSSVYFDNIESFNGLVPSGSRIFKSGPRNGLHFDNDNDFRNGDIGINVNDNYMTMFSSVFTPLETGNYQFKCERPDDFNAIWIDLDGDKAFSRSAGGGVVDEAILIQNGYTNSTVFSDTVSLTANQNYKIAFIHGERWGGSRIKPSIKTPSKDWEIIDPSSPSQDGFFSVPFDSTISTEVSASIFAKHGASERIALYEGNVSIFHDVDIPSNDSVISNAKMETDKWKYLTVSVDCDLGEIKIFEDGNLTASQSFPPNTLAKEVARQDWYFGQGLIPVSFDELRLAKVSRSHDWIKTEYQNQKVIQLFLLS